MKAVGCLHGTGNDSTCNETCLYVSLHASHMARSNSSPAHESKKQDQSPEKHSKILPAKYDWKVELIHACRVIAAKLITTGNTGILLLMTIGVSLTAKLTSADLRDVLKSILDNHTLGLMGWGFFVSAVVVGYRLVRGLRELQEREIDHLTNQHLHEMERMRDAHDGELKRLGHPQPPARSFNLLEG